MKPKYKVKFIQTRRNPISTPLGIIVPGFTLKKRTVAEVYKTYTPEKNRGFIRKRPVTEFVSAIPFNTRTGDTGYQLRNYKSKFSGMRSPYALFSGAHSYDDEIRKAYLKSKRKRR